MHCVEDLGGLASPDEPTFRLGPVCHEGAPLTAVFLRPSESVTLSCSVCGTGVVDLAIATKASRSRRRKRLEVAESPKVVQRMDGAARKNRNGKRR